MIVKLIFNPETTIDIISIYEVTREDMDNISDDLNWNIFDKYGFIYSFYGNEDSLYIDTTHRKTLIGLSIGSFRGSDEVKNFIREKNLKKILE